MRFSSPLRHGLTAVCCILLMLVVTGEARATDSYDPVTRVLTMPALVIGSATYSDVAITVASIVTLPSGSSANGSVDRYDPASGQLTVQSVALNNKTYYNAVVTVRSLDSIGGVSGADAYASGNLSVSSVQVGSAFYVDVVLAASVANIVGVRGGMPLATVDSFSPSSGELTVPAVQAFGHVYTNVTLKVGLANVAAVGGTAGRFAYVANSGSGTISAYSINRQTGSLTPLASGTIQVPGSVNLYEVHIDPSGKYLYVLDSGATGIYGYSINPSDGSLTALNGGAPFAAGGQPQSLVFDSTGVYAYVTNIGDGTLWAYGLDTSTGALNALSGSPYSISGSAVNAEPEQIVRSGNHLYVADYQSGAVEVFTITGGTGALQRGVAGSPFSTDVGPYSLAVDPTGSVLYTANAGSLAGPSISAFTINAVTGALQAVAGNPLAIPAAEYLSFEPSGRFLFVAETGALGVYPFNRSTGAVGSQVSGSPFATGSYPNIAVADPTGRFVYVGNDGSADISEFTLNATTGLLSPVNGTPVPAGTYPDFIAIR